LCTHEKTYANGACRDCDRAAQARYRRRRRLAMALLYSAEARGFSGAEALALIQHADPVTVRECAAAGFTPVEVR
jgi:hypothetical protein